MTGEDASLEAPKPESLGNETVAVWLPAASFGASGAWPAGK